MVARGRNHSGQGTVEWIGIVFLVAMLVGGALVAAGDRLPGGVLARTIAGAIVCAARLADSCGGEREQELAAAYGEEVAALAREHAPRLRYERGMRALPVDYRRCREDACSTGAPTGEVAPRTISPSRTNTRMSGSWIGYMSWFATWMTG